MQIRLAAFEIASEEIGRRPPFEDARDLLCDEGRAAVLVIDAGEPENDGLYVAALAADQSFGFHLRFWVGPRRIERRILVDPDSLFRAGRVDEQGAGEDELLGLQRLEGGKQPTRSLYRDGVIFRIVLPRRVVISREVNDGGDAPVAAFAHLFDRLRDAVVRGEIDGTVSVPFAVCLALGRSKPMTRYRPFNPLVIA